MEEAFPGRGADAHLVALPQREELRALAAQTLREAGRVRFGTAPGDDLAQARRERPTQPFVILRRIQRSRDRIGEPPVPDAPGGTAVRREVAGEGDTHRRLP